VEGTDGSEDLDRLRLLGAELARSGISVDRVQIVPLLWFATPVLLSRLRRAARVAAATARTWLAAAFGVGLCAWLVAVPASLWGAAEVTRSAHWVGTWIGLLLYCTAMVRLSVGLRWPAYERRWLQAARTAGLALALAVPAALLMLSAEVFEWPESSGAQLLVAVPLVGSLLLELAALVRTARIHGPTHAALTSVPTSTPFSVGSPTPEGGPRRPADGSGPVQQE
jgi:hypothetical protein